MTFDGDCHEHNLPAEIVSYIIDFLPYDAFIYELGLVCRLWQEICHAESRWKQNLLKKYPGSTAYVFDNFFQAFQKLEANFSKQIGEEDIVLNITAIGSADSGKTALVLQFTQGLFPSVYYPTM
jgi:hypothetical protein